MRSRSSTVRLKSSPFKETPPTKSQTSLPDLPDQDAPSKAVLSTREKLKLFEDFGPVTFGSVKDSFSGDFQMPGSPRTCSTAAASTSCLATLSRLSTLDDDSTEDAKPSRLFRGMIIGARGSGRHSLVNAICPGEDNKAKMKQEFDLVTRTLETEKEVKRLNFWLRETKPGQRYDSLVKTYYKSCRVFFFVYDFHNKESFEVLNNEIQLIREANVGKELLFVLIGNKRAGRKCQVSFKEALEWKKQNNVKLFLEADLSQEKLHNIMDIPHLLAK